MLLQTTGYTLLYMYKEGCYMCLFSLSNICFCISIITCHTDTTWKCIVSICHNDRDVKTIDNDCQQDY